MAFKYLLIVILFLVSCTNPFESDPKNEAGQIGGLDKQNGQPPTFSYELSIENIATVGSNLLIVPKILDSQGASIVKSCKSSPELPDGLILENSSCQIRGVPIEPLEETKFIITALNDFGSTEALLFLKVETGLPVFEYQNEVVKDGRIGKNFYLAPKAFNNGGLPITSCTSTPDLPEGLVLDNSCTISGTPVRSNKQTNYSISAKNAKGSTKASFVLGIICPTGYINVPANSELEMLNDFCVAKFEMKKNRGFISSIASEFPEVNINRDDAKAQCKFLGPSYALITNQEWMTIARNIELVGSNWSSGISGVGVLARGHSDGNPNNSLQASEDDSQSFLFTENRVGQLPNAGWEQKRTLKLANGEVIWDFSGNVAEWVDWSVSNSKKAFHSMEGTSVFSWRDWKKIDRNIGENIDDIMLPSTWSSSFVKFINGIPSAELSLDRKSGIGSYSAGHVTLGGAAIRGGAWTYSDHAGAFSLILSSPETRATSNVGFRCVWR